MKYFASLLLTIFIAQIATAQDDYEKFIQAILKRDTVFAQQIERNYTQEHKIEPIKEYPFPVRNISEHIFKFNINVLKDSLISFFKIGNSPEENLHLMKIFYFYVDTRRMSVFFTAEKSKGAIFSREYFLQPNTSNDVYLTGMLAPWVSKYYYSDSQPIQYSADFVFKLIKIDQNSTVVKVVAINPEIIRSWDWEYMDP